MGAAASAWPEDIDRDTFMQMAAEYAPQYFDDNADPDSGKLTKKKLMKLAKRTDVFLSHNWGNDEQNR